ncbi:MAG: GerMN domain-containing protein [Defluviitaleaceae bacterium]|nr:GerMN domain-containing protein [Defluviitaleaceae bacterium]
MKSRKKIRIGGIAIILLIALYTVIFGHPWAFRQEEGNTMNVYFFNPTSGRLESERRTVPVGNYREVAAELWDILRFGPDAAPLSNVFPENLTGQIDLRIVRTTFEDFGIRSIEIDMNESYLYTPAINEIIFRSAVVWTFTELDWVSDVVFFVNGTPLTRLDGESIGAMDRDNVLINPQITMEHVVRKTVELYFANSNLTGLVAERRTIEVPSNVTEEWVILQELMRGPRTEGLLSLIPPETIINDVYTESLTMTCYVDLSPVFDSRLTPGAPLRQLAVYSIVNTLARLSSGNVARVQFLINSERVPSRNLDVDLSQVFEPDESLIISRVEMELM